MAQMQQEQNQYKNPGEQFLNSTYNVLPITSNTSIAELQPNIAKQCRICLQTEVCQSNPMVTPCMCIGTVKYVHDLCFRQWIERQVNQSTEAQLQKMKKEGVECELCKTKMRLVISKKYRCCTYSNFVERYSHNKFLFYLFIFFILLDIGYITFLIFKTSHNTSPQLIIFIITIVSFLLLTFIALLGAYYLITKYLIQIIHSLERYQREYQCQPQSKKKRISKGQVANLDIIE